VDEWRRAAHTYELLAEEHVVTANNVGAFYKYVFKRTTNHSGIGIKVKVKVAHTRLPSVGFRS